MIYSFMICIISWFIISWFIISWFINYSCFIISWFIISCSIISWFIVSWFIILWFIISWFIIACFIHTYILMYMCIYYIHTYIRYAYIHRSWFIIPWVTELMNSHAGKLVLPGGYNPIPTWGMAIMGRGEPRPNDGRHHALRHSYGRHLSFLGLPGCWYPLQGSFDVQTSG